MRKLIVGGLTALAVGLSGQVLTPTAQAAADQDTVAQFVAAVNAEADRWGLSPIQVSVANLGDDSIVAGTQYGVITLNLPYANLSPDQFNASVEDDIAAGYQPGGCGGIQAVAIHEVAHVIDQRNGAYARQVLTRAVAAGQVGTDLHGYAFENGVINPGEAIAVSFQATECGSATATERRIYNLLVS